MIPANRSPIQQISSELLVHIWLASAYTNSLDHMLLAHHEHGIDLVTSNARAKLLAESRKPMSGHVLTAAGRFGSCGAFADR